MTTDGEPRSSLPDKIDLSWADSDGDGLSDAEEWSLGTNPYSADTDGDGLADGEELLRTHTNPRMRDTDQDGVDDRAEIRAGRNPRRAEERAEPKFLDWLTTFRIVTTASRLLDSFDTSSFRGDQYWIERSEDELWIGSQEQGTLLHWNGEQADPNRLTADDAERFAVVARELDLDWAKISPSLMEQKNEIELDV